MLAVLTIIDEKNARSMGITYFNEDFKFFTSNEFKNYCNSIKDDLHIILEENYDD